MHRLFLASAFFAVISADYPNCTFAKDEEDRGYYGMLVNGKRSDEAKNGEMKVELLCVGVEKHLYFCLNGVLKPFYDWKTGCGCDPVNISGLDYENDKYTMPFTPSSSDDLFLDGKYREGVKWTRTCSSGPVVEGKSSSVCAGGKWVPTPGRCPWMCSTEQVRKDAGFSRVTFYSYPHSTWVKSGEKTQGFCSVNILRVKQYGLTCNDGNWLPENVSCPEDLRTHYP